MTAAQPFEGGPQLVDEPSAWMRATGAKRVRHIKNLHLDTSAYGMVIAPIGRTGRPGSREDRSCDRCRSYVPEGRTLHMFVYRATPLIHLAGGLCSVCARKEAS